MSLGLCRKITERRRGRTRRWIHVEKKNLHGQTQGNVWTLEVDDLLLRRDCLDRFELPFIVRYGTVKKLTVVWRDKHTLQIAVDTVFVVLESRSADRTPSSEELKEMEEKVHRLLTAPRAPTTPADCPPRPPRDGQTKRALLEHWEAQLDGSLSNPALEDPGAAPGAANEGGGPREEHGKGQADAYRALIDKLEARTPQPPHAPRVRLGRRLTATPPRFVRRCRLGAFTCATTTRRPRTPSARVCSACRSRRRGAGRARARTTPHTSSRLWRSTVSRSTSTRATPRGTPPPSPAPRSDKRLRPGGIERFAKTLRHKSATSERNMYARRTLW